MFNLYCGITGWSEYQLCKMGMASLEDAQNLMIATLGNPPSDADRAAGAVNPLNPTESELDKELRLQQIAVLNTDSNVRWAYQSARGGAAIEQV